MALVKPTTYQINALSSLGKLRNNKALTVLPSGSGKTYLAAFDAKSVNAKSILYIVHRNEILDQSRKIFAEVLNLKQEDIGIINGDLKQFDRKAIFATIQTLGKPKSIEQIRDRRFDYVIIDEFHHVAALTYQTVLESLQYGFLHGLTATPYRLDGKDVTAFVDKNIIYSRNLQEAIQDGELVPFLYNGLWDDVDYNSIEWNGYKYRENDLNKVLLIDARDRAIIKNFKELIGVGTRQTIGFCVSVKHAERMAAKFNQVGIPSMAITWKTDYAERRSLIQLFRQKRYQVVFTRDIFNEGVDFPEVEALLFLRPTVSKTVFYQQIGRGLRKAPNKENVIALDFIGNYRNAWHIQEWLDFARVSNEPLGHKERKPEYHYSIPQVHFDKEVVDLFEYQESIAHHPTYTKQDIIDEYFRVKKILGRQPLSDDFREKAQRKHNTKAYNSPIVYRIHMSSIVRRFGTFTKLLKEIGDYRFDKDNLKRLYLETKKRLGITDRPIRYREAKELKGKGLFPISVGTYDHIFGSWGRFLKEIGEIGEDWHQYKSKYNKEKLKQNYVEVKAKLGRVPTYGEIGDPKISKYSNSAYRAWFGNWSKALIEFGDVPYLHIRDEETGKYVRLPKKTYRDPASGKYRKLPIRRKPIYPTRDDLRGMYVKLRKKIGDTSPNVGDWKKEYGIRLLGAVQSRFTKWNDFVYLNEGGKFKVKRCPICTKTYKKYPSSDDAANKGDICSPECDRENDRRWNRIHREKMNRRARERYQVKHGGGETK